MKTTVTTPCPKCKKAVTVAVNCGLYHDIDCPKCGQKISVVVDVKKAPEK